MNIKTILTPKVKDKLRDYVPFIAITLVILLFWGISGERFLELAEDAKNNCPISGALNCEIILNPSLN